MLVFLNGRFVREEEAVVSVFDRSFLYGDGLFETMLVADGKPFRWMQHLERLGRGADFLKIKLPFSSAQLFEFAQNLIAENKMPDALLRLTVSRGVGVRGYLPRGAENPTVVMSLHENPAAALLKESESGARQAVHPDASVFPKWKLTISSLRLPANEPLAQFKTCNKLPQILARAEADSASADEALLLNTDGFVVEGASSNLFWIEHDSICTPPLASGVLPGVTRAVVVEICESLGMEIRECNVSAELLKKMNGVFVSLSSWGIVEAESLDGCLLGRSPLTEKIRAAYWKCVRVETM
ncbi:MAG TPA: aminotransferase class IV [Verrucomicrobiae bacterium]|nr:aminotransferase class IV [Verrucomicrobiae bacterium]